MNQIKDIPSRIKKSFSRYSKPENNVCFYIVLDNYSILNLIVTVIKNGVSYATEMIDNSHDKVIIFYIQQLLEKYLSEKKEIGKDLKFNIDEDITIYFNFTIKSIDNKFLIKYNPVGIYESKNKRKLYNIILIAGKEGILLSNLIHKARSIPKTERIAILEDLIKENEIIEKIIPGKTKIGKMYYKAP